MPQDTRQKSFQNQHSVVAAQFGGRAAAYVASEVHSSGADLDWMEAAVRGHGEARALDLGCGGGHVGYRVAPHVGSVIACDLAPEMLAAVSAEAKRRGLANLSTCEAAAENLPFEAESFDFVLCRFSAHHWNELALGLAEAARVLKRGGRALFVDSCAPDHAAFDSHMQAIEVLRDPSHVRNYSAPQWVAALSAAGLSPDFLTRASLRMDFAPWTERMRTPEAGKAAIRYLQEALSRQARAHFAVEPDGSFMLDTIWLGCAKAV